jgi:hypothetical protein
MVVVVVVVVVVVAGVVVVVGVSSLAFVSTLGDSYAVSTRYFGFDMSRSAGGGNAGFGLLSNSLGSGAATDVRSIFSFEMLFLVEPSVATSIFSTTPPGAACSTVIPPVLGSA